MASDRVLIVRVLGIGLASGTNNAAAFTSRAGLPYLGVSEVPGVVVDVGSQLSSNIDIFGALGSDPTTTFTLLSTAVTSQLTLSRGKRPLLDADNANVTVTDYISPFGTSNLGFIAVTDTSNCYPGMMLRVANTVFEVDTVWSATSLQVRRRWGSADVPIPMGVTGFGIFGATVYDVTPSNPTGGIESLPVVISTAPLSATSRVQEEIIFRGVVNKAATDTSAHGTNKIKVDCGSMMSYVKSAKFTPAQGGTRVFPKRATDATQALTNSAMNVDFWWQIVHDQRLYGTPFEVSGDVGNVRVPLMQIRSDAWGGTVALDPDQPWAYETIDDYAVLVAQVSTRYRLDPANPTFMNSNTFLSTFRDGWYGNGGFGPSLEPSITRTAVYGTTTNAITGQTVPTQFPIGYSWQVQDAWFNPEMLGETTFIAKTFADLIVDLLLGTFNGESGTEEYSFTTGCRAATEAAWLPFGVQAGVSSVQDIIDIGSLLRAVSPFGGALRREQPTTPEGIAQAVFGSSSGFMLPYLAADAKTVGDVLEEILKRSGLYMVYDKGKFRFGRWSQRPPTPTVVNDTGLAEPKVSLTFDRNNCVQTALMKVCWRADGDSPVTQAVPVNNIDLGIGAIGKVVNLSHWLPLGTIEYLPDSDMFLNAVNLVTRYSQAAALVDVVYRDDVFDLVVGQQVAFSSDYVPNADGSMGVTLATGFVLKAARSWQTPTTAYTIALPGYLSPINRVSVFSCSGTVVSVVGDDVTIAPNDFTQPAGQQASEAAPTSDAQAFDLSLQLQGGPLLLVLRDQYGTSRSAGALLYPGDVSGNTLLGLPAIAAVAVPGDVVVLARATAQSSVDTLWDAFQADTAGQVNGSPVLAYQWVR
jgi:hypothetical protein